MPVFIAIPCSLVMPATVHTTVYHCAPPSVMIGPIIKSSVLSTQYSVAGTDTIAELYDRFSFISDRFCKCSLIVGFPLVSRFNSVIKRSQSKDTGANRWVLYLKLTIKSRVHCCHENLNNNLLSDWV